MSLSEENTGSAQSLCVCNPLYGNLTLTIFHHLFICWRMILYLQMRQHSNWAQKCSSRRLIELHSRHSIVQTMLGKKLSHWVMERGWWKRLFHIHKFSTNHLILHNESYHVPQNEGNLVISLLGNIWFIQIYLTDFSICTVSNDKKSWSTLNWSFIIFIYSSLLCWGSWLCDGGMLERYLRRSGKMEG